MSRIASEDTAIQSGVAMPSRDHKPFEMALSHDSADAMASGPV